MTMVTSKGKVGHVHIAFVWRKSANRLAPPKPCAVLRQTRWLLPRQRDVRTHDTFSRLRDHHSHFKLPAQDHEPRA